MSIPIRVKVDRMRTQVEKVAWACPRCGADANKHGKGGSDKCLESGSGRECQGFLCECDNDEPSEDHGQTHEDPCPSANCYHCGWYGVFPLKPAKLKGWAKTAWEAGWRPPAGWKGA
jgi:hypothetical protein